MYSEFIKWVRKQLELLERAECPTHLECGGQDHWYEVKEAQVTEFKSALAVVDDECGTDKDKFWWGTEVLSRLREEYVDVVHQELIDSIHEHEFYFFGRYEHYKMTGQDVIS